jgi:hypothetical protein
MPLDQHAASRLGLMAVGCAVGLPVWHVGSCTGAGVDSSRPCFCSSVEFGLAGLVVGTWGRLMSKRAAAEGYGCCKKASDTVCSVQQATAAQCFA